MAEKKDLPVKVVSAKSGEEDILKSIQANTNNDLSRMVEERYSKEGADPEGYIKYSEGLGDGKLIYPSRFDRALRSGAKAALIKKRRGKKRK